ncbi:MAG: hypothetical protein ILO68_07905, partial [Clostridia bacterium]|nr:hypothetical protein [Clostridia bacterium]
NGNPIGEGTPTGGKTHGPKVPGTPFQKLLEAAAGGRFTSPTKAEIAEDGDPEYVIPVKKESLALPLLRQLIGELSGSARDALRRDLGENSPALSGLPSLLSSARAAAAPVITQNQTNSVQAPVTIEVHAEGSSPEEIGRSIYDVAERYLLRTLADLSVL